MNTSNYEAEIYEIDQLLSLAENVDDHIRQLEQTLLTSRKHFISTVTIQAIGIVAFIVTFLGSILQPSDLSRISSIMGAITSFVLIVSLSASIFLLTLYQKRTQDDYEKRLQIEDGVIGTLVPRLSSLIEGIKPHVSIVTYATMEMRLSRVRFAPSRMLPKSPPTKIRNAPAEVEIAVNEI